jgi:hypothetical protein
MASSSKENSMRDLYFYEYSDDLIDWRLGGYFESLMKCVDNAEQCCYSYRIKKAKVSDPEPVSREERNQALKDLIAINKILK